MGRCLTILYRGPLASCNYRCAYCPFAKQRDSAAELAYDRQCLDRFVHWVTGRPVAEISLLLTPWGEALVRTWYQQALVTLSQLEFLRRVVIQTNLSATLDWVANADVGRLALWCTYHPTQTSRNQFLGQCRRLLDAGVRFSVGMVGLREHLVEIQAMRKALPPQVYLWINAYQDVPHYYQDAEVQLLTDIDPLFPWNLRPHASLQASCRTGESVISVDGEGNVRRCHFIPHVIGNLYDPQWVDCLQSRRCSNDSCQCHIGYVHLDKLQLYDVYGPHVLERIPARWPLQRGG